MQNKLNWWWVGAGIMSLLTSLLHILGGGPEIMEPLAQIEMPKALFAIMDVIWHEVSLLLILVGLAFLLASKRGEKSKDMVLFINVFYAGIAAIFIFAGIFYLQDIWPLPQWILFIIMAGVGHVGWIKQK